MNLGQTYMYLCAKNFAKLSTNLFHYMNALRMYCIDSTGVPTVKAQWYLSFARSPTAFM